MKKLFLSMALALLSTTAFSQDVLGKWVTEGGDSQVEITKNGDKVSGKIIWLKAGKDKLDSKNPDAALKTRKLVGSNILTGLKLKGEKWEGGKVYNPKNGKTYKCVIWTEDGKLKVRGYLGMFYETQTWTRK